MDIDNLGPIYLGGYAIKVEDASKELCDRGLMGFMSTLNMKIQIRTEDTSGQVAAQCLVHETLHAIDEIYSEGNNLTEAQVASISQGLYQLIVDNPDFLAAIQREGEIAAGECCHDGYHHDCPVETAESQCSCSPEGVCGCGYTFVDTPAS